MTICATKNAHGRLDILRILALLFSTRFLIALIYLRRRNLAVALPYADAIGADSIPRPTCGVPLPLEELPFDKVR